MFQHCCFSPDLNAAYVLYEEFRCNYDGTFNVHFVTLSRSQCCSAHRWLISDTTLYAIRPPPKSHCHHPPQNSLRIFDCVVAEDFLSQGALMSVTLPLSYVIIARLAGLPACTQCTLSLTITWQWTCAIYCFALVWFSAHYLKISQRLQGWPYLDSLMCASYHIDTIKMAWDWISTNSFALKYPSLNQLINKSLS